MFASPPRPHKRSSHMSTKGERMKRGRGKEAARGGEGCSEGRKERKEHRERPGRGDKASGWVKTLREREREREREIFHPQLQGLNSFPLRLPSSLWLSCLKA